MQLVDFDVANIPMIASDPYGNFIPGPTGLPQYVTQSGLVEGNLPTPVPAPADVLAHRHRVPQRHRPQRGADRTSPDADTEAGGSLDPVAAGEYDNELLDLHFICGDGRCNENIALERHPPGVPQRARPNDRRHRGHTEPQPRSARGLPGDVDATTFEYGERLFQAARFVTEMEYQHLVFEEFARKVQPAINPFPRVRIDPDRHQRGDHRRVRPRGLPLRPLDAQREHSSHQRERLGQLHRVCSRAS